MSEEDDEAGPMVRGAIGPLDFSRLWTAPELDSPHGNALAVQVSMPDGTMRIAARVGADGRATFDWEAVERGTRVIGPGSEVVAGVCRLMLAARRVG